MIGPQLPHMSPAAVEKFRCELARWQLETCYTLPAKRRPVRMTWRHWLLLPVAVVLLVAEAAMEACGL